MDEPKFIQPTYTIAIRVWWSFFWREVCLFFIGGILVGIVGGTIARVLYTSGYFFGTKFYGILGGLLAVLIIYPVLVWITKIVLKKEYQDFKIVVVVDKGGVGMKFIPPTWEIAFRVWWSIFWRSALISIPHWILKFGFVLKFPEWVSGIFFFILIPAYIYVIKVILNKKYKDFKLAIVANPYTLTP